MPSGYAERGKADMWLAILQIPEQQMNGYMIAGTIVLITLGILRLVDWFKWRKGDKVVQVREGYAPIYAKRNGDRYIRPIDYITSAHGRAELAKMSRWGKKKRTGTVP